TVHQAERFRAHHGVGEVEARAAEFHRLVDAEEARIAHLLEQLVGGELARAFPLVDMRIDLAIHQSLPGLAQRLVFGRELHRYILATPKVIGLSGRTSDSRAIDRVKASTRRVSRGSMMPSSHRCAVP